MTKKKKKEKKKEEERIKNIHIIYPRNTIGSGNVGAACKVFPDFFF